MSSHFLSHPEPIAHFGLGADAGPVYRVRVAFPGRFAKTSYSVSPNQTVVVDNRANRCGLLGIEPFVVLIFAPRLRRSRHA